MRSLDELIFEIAEHGREADYGELYERMHAHVFYVSLGAPLAGPAGSKITVGDGVTTKYVVMNRMKLLVFYTATTHPQLGAVYGGIEGSEALQLTLAAPGIDGALFHNASSSWVGLDKQKCREVLGG